MEVFLSLQANEDPDPPKCPRSVVHEVLSLRLCSPMLMKQLEASIVVNLAGQNLKLLNVAEDMVLVRGKGGHSIFEVHPEIFSHGKST